MSDIFADQRGRPDLGALVYGSPRLGQYFHVYNLSVVYTMGTPV